MLSWSVSHTAGHLQPLGSLEYPHGIAVEFADLENRKCPRMLRKYFSYQTLSEYFFERLGDYGLEKCKSRGLSGESRYYLYVI